ncbi:MAG TPA: type II toxin-antitoxin system CcdA family antitoxin [Actinomycetales bacterium]|nr:type II toxin-antitoxin system CcdA family antitoxin [Actinomycetales bacterium]
MAKRKITVTVDEGLVEAAQELGHLSLSATVNAALAAEVDRRARAAALGRLLTYWDESYGPVSSAAVRKAAAAFDDLDATAAFDEVPVPPAPRRRSAGRGAA